MDAGWMRLVSTSVVACIASCKGDGGAAEDDGIDDAVTVGSEDEAETSGSMKFDVLGNDETEGPEGGDEASEDGCEKVDFLFVIDSSNSLKEEQAQLIGSFPGFVAEIEETVTAQDYHVGVVSSDAYVFNTGCTNPGALIVSTGGKDSSMSVCGPFAAGNFMTKADDLDTAFACTAQIGTGGANDEKMFLGATRAVAADMNQPGACNDGFLRDDALLVLVLITDEDDPGTCIGGVIDCEGSPGDPASWYQQIVDAKGAEKNVVVLSLVWGAPNNVCGPPPGTEKLGQRVMDFTALFTHAFVGDICAPSYDGFFEAAVAGIDTACDEFIPPG